jgi:hypothetical protein
MRKLQSLLFVLLFSTASHAFAQTGNDVAVRSVKFIHAVYGGDYTAAKSQLSPKSELYHGNVLEEQTCRFRAATGTFDRFEHTATSETPTSALFNGIAFFANGKARVVIRYNYRMEITSFALFAVKPDDEKIFQPVLSQQ